MWKKKEKSELFPAHKYQSISDRSINKKNQNQTQTFNLSDKIKINLILISRICNLNEISVKSVDLKII